MWNIGLENLYNPENLLKILISPCISVMQPNFLQRRLMQHFKSYHNDVYNVTEWSAVLIWLQPVANQ